MPVRRFHTIARFVADDPRDTPRSVLRDFVQFYPQWWTAARDDKDGLSCRRDKGKFEIRIPIPEDGFTAKQERDFLAWHEMLPAFVTAFQMRIRSGSGLRIEDRAWVHATLWSQGFYRFLVRVELFDLERFDQMVQGPYSLSGSKLYFRDQRDAVMATLMHEPFSNRN